MRFSSCAVESALASGAALMGGGEGGGGDDSSTGVRVAVMCAYASTSCAFTLAALGRSSSSVFILGRRRQRIFKPLTISQEIIAQESFIGRNRLGRERIASCGCGNVVGAYALLPKYTNFTNNEGAFRETLRLYFSSCERGVCKIRIPPNTQCDL